MCSKVGSVLKRKVCLAFPSTFPIATSSSVVFDALPEEFHSWGRKLAVSQLFMSIKEEGNTSAQFLLPVVSRMSSCQALKMVCAGMLLFRRT